jgi:hypothetical protein
MRRIRGRFAGAFGGLAVGLMAAAGALAAPQPEPHDFTIRDFHFRPGEN